MRLSDRLKRLLLALTLGGAALLAAPLDGGPGAIDAATLATLGSR